MDVVGEYGSVTTRVVSLGDLIDSDVFENRRLERGLSISECVRIIAVASDLANGLSQI